MDPARRWIVWAGVLLAWACHSPARGDPPPAVAADPLTAAHLTSLQLSAYRRTTAPPAFSLRTPEGRTVSLAGLRGRVVLLNFWASWCLECRPEMPALEALHRRFGARGLAVVGINAREGPTVVLGYARELGLTFPLVLDSDDAVRSRYGVIGLPTTFLIGRDGQAVALAVGAREWTSAAALDVVTTLLGVPSEEPGRPANRQ